VMKIGLDIGTGFVKCVSDYGAVRFPSIYVRRIHGLWTEKATEAVGDKAGSLLDTMGATAISPIVRGKPDSRYYKQVDMLLAETMRQVHKLAKDLSTRTQSSASWSACRTTRSATASPWSG